MRRFLWPIAILLASLLVLGVFIGWRFWPAPGRGYTPSGPGDVYLALGDSLAWGARLENPQTESYPALLHQRLTALRPLELVNLAVPGETSASILRRQLPDALALIERERRAGRRVSPITIDIGGNDLRGVERAGTPERQAAVEATRRNIAQLLDALRRAAGDQADIVVMTYYNPYGGDPTVVDSEAYWVAQLNTAIQTEAAQRGVAVADTYAPFEGGRVYSYTFILVGDVHANSEGHEVIAEQFWLALGYE